MSEFPGADCFLQKLSTSLPDVWELRPRLFQDARGFFLETYHRKKFVDLGICQEFVQDNHSVSAKGTLRGLHYQLRQPQAKLCRVIEGVALDIAVDIRAGSPTFGKSACVVLSAETRNQVFIPEGFAHGFIALGERVQFLYKCSDFYDPSDEYGIIWNDPDLAISWGSVNPLLSERDSRYPKLSDVPPEFLPKFSKK
jgi:dTDP-4-dehydrorhamnose 3,5-epimerase